MHYINAGRLQKARTFLILAGDHAFGMAAPQEALILYNFLLSDHETMTVINADTPTKLLTPFVSIPTSSPPKATAAEPNQSSPMDEIKVRENFFSIEGKSLTHERGHIYRMMGESYYYLGNYDDATAYFDLSLKCFGPETNSWFYRTFPSSGSLKKKVFRHYIYTYLIHIRSKKKERNISKHMSLPQRELAKERSKVWHRLTNIHYKLGN